MRRYLVLAVFSLITPHLYAELAERDPHAIIVAVVQSLNPKVSAEAEFPQLVATATVSELEKIVAICLETGLWDLGLRASQRWTELDVNSLSAWQSLAAAALHAEDVAQATDAMKQLLKLSDRSQTDKYSYARSLLIGEGRPKLALDVYKNLAKRKSRLVEAQYSLATLALVAGELAEAERYARKAIKLDDDLPLAKILLANILVDDGRVKEGVDLARVVATEHSNNFDVRFRYATLLTRADLDGESLFELQSLIEENPQVWAAVRALALTEMSREEYVAAKRRFAWLVQNDKYIDESFYYLGSIAQKLGEREAALSLFFRVVQGRYALDAQMRAADLAFHLGQQERALNHLQALYNRFPFDKRTLVQAHAGLLADSAKYEEALTRLESMIDVYPHDAELVVSQAFVLESSGELGKAIDLLSGLAAAHPENATVLNALGYTLADHTQRYEEAYAYIEKALTLQPESAAIIDSMGWVQFKLGRLDEAIEHLELAYEKFPDAEVAAHLGEVLWRHGKQDRARAIWQDAQEVAPNHEVLQQTLERFGIE